jgi:hypothetical protein
MQTNDFLWKGIIEDLAEDFLLYFLSRILMILIYREGLNFWIKS